MSVYEILAQAIQSKKPCVIAKPNEPSRSICPYRMGKSSRGETNLVYYKFDGYTSRPGGLEPDGSSANWRCNHVRDIAVASITEGTWHEPLAKPKTRGSCVVDPPDYEVAY